MLFVSLLSILGIVYKTSQFVKLRLVFVFLYRSCVDVVDDGKRGQKGDRLAIVSNPFRFDGNVVVWSAVICSLLGYEQLMNGAHARKLYPSYLLLHTGINNCILVTSFV